MIPGIVAGFPISGSPPASPRRAWSVLITLNDGSTLFCGMSDLVLRAIAGGPDLTSPPETWRAGASSEINTDNLAANAFDSVAASGWLSDTTGPSRIWWDFGAAGGAYQSIAEIAITGSWNAPDASPRDFSLQWTDDDPAGTPTWTTAASWAGETGWTGGSDTRVFAV